MRRHLSGVGPMTNALANSTKEMGPGSHQDILDDHFGDYNWHKIIIIGAYVPINC